MRSPGFDKRASGRTLLIVEDDADIRDALDGLLSMEGFRVSGCSNGREALDWLHSSPKPDLILLDLMMPVMDGWQFLQAVRQEAALSAIPVVVVSAADRSQARAAALGVAAYLQKPLDPADVAARVQRLAVRP